MTDVNPHRLNIDSIMHLAESVTEDPGLRDLYVIITQEMINQVSHLSVPMTGYMLIDRIATLFVTMKERERAGLPFTGTVADKAIYKAWSDVVLEFNKMVITADIDRHRQLLHSITEIIMSTLKSQVADEHLRRNLALTFVSALEQAGVA